MATRMTGYHPAETALEREEGKLLAFWHHQFTHFTQHYARWIHIENPAGQAVCFVVCDADGKVIGTAAWSPRVFSVGDQTVVAGQAIDFAVDRRHRLGRAANALQKAVLDSMEQNRLAFLYGFPLPTLETISLRNGFVPLQDTERWTRVLRSDYKLGKWIKSAPLRRIASPLVDGILRLWSRVAGWADGRYKGEIRPTLDNHIDDLWRNARDQFRIAGERSAAFLRWRFCACPDRRYQFFHLFRGRELCGYIAFRRRGNMIDIDDFLFSAREHIAPLFRVFANNVRADGASAIIVTYLGPASIGEGLRNAGFFRRPDDRHILVYAPKHKGTTALLDKSACFFTSADRDI